MDEEINLKEFLDERNDEINELIDSLDRKKKTLEFQRLPFYKRRKCKSISNKKKQKAKLIKSTWLPMHIFYAKRFHMELLNSKKVPLTRFLKSDKYIYKSAHRGFLFSEGFLGIEIVNELENYDISTMKENKFYDLCINKEAISLCKLAKNKLIIQSPKIQSEFSCFNIYFGKRLIPGKYHYEDFKKIFTDEEITENYISKYLKKYNKLVDYSSFEFAKEEEFFYIYETKNLWEFKIIFNAKFYKLIFHNFVVNGFIPISMKELHRISLETNVILKYDILNSKFYEKVEEFLHKTEFEKYNRTPKGKRKNYANNKFEYPYKINKNYKDIHIFTAKKGNFIRGSEIYANNILWGVVLRGGYCFTTGKEKGIVALLNFDQHQDYIMKSIKNGKFYEIKKIAP